MAVRLRIPKLGVSVTEATLIEWLVPDNARVRAGDAIYRIETDKVEQDVEATGDGVLHHDAIEGETYAVGFDIGWIES